MAMQSMPSPNDSGSASPKHSSDDMRSNSDDSDAKSRRKRKSKRKSKKKKRKKHKSKRIKTEPSSAADPSVSVDDALLSIQILSEQIAQIKALAEQRNVSLDHPDIKTYLERLNRLKMFARQKIEAQDHAKKTKSVESLST